MDGDAPRVVADAHHYIIYSLKNRSTLRLLARSNNLQNIIKLHKKDVTLVKFVNFKSNVVASCGDTDEFFVWFVGKGADDKPEATVYFRLQHTVPLKIRAFAWFVDAATNSPNILMTANDGSHVLNAGTTISRYTNAEVTIGFAEFAKNLERAVSPVAKAFTCVGAEGMLAFNLSSTTVVTCTLRNTNTPAWKPSEGEDLVGLEMLQTRSAVLVAASASSVWVWAVSAEPQLLHKLHFGIGSVFTLAATGTSFAVFTPTKTAYVVDATQSDAGSSAIAGLVAEKFQLSKQITPLMSLSPSADTKASSFVITADFGEKLAIVVLKKTEANGVDVSGAVVSSEGSPFLPPPPTRRDTQPQLSQAVLPPYGAGSAPRPAFATPVGSPFLQGSPLVLGAGRPLLNPSLPQLSQDGVIAQALEETGREVQAAKERVDSALQNTAQILLLAATNVKKDHTALTTLALEAQMTELQRAGVGSAPASAAPAAQAGASSALFEQKFVNQLLDEVASTIIEGLIPGVRAAVLEELEPRIRTVVAAQWKKTNRDAFKQRVDALLNDSSAAFIAELETKQKTYEKNLEFYAKEVKKTAEGGLQKLSSQIIVLEDQLNAISQSRLLDEVRTLRGQVKDLKAQIAAGQAQPLPDIPATTLVAAAKRMILGGKVADGLDYAARVEQAEVTLALLAELDADFSEEQHNAVVEHTGVSDKVWTDILSHCAHATKIQRLPVALGWIRNVLGERPHLLQASVALKDALQRFTTVWKPQVTQDKELTQKLKQIERTVS